jgi:two-component system, cell cycle sensor histidine kinase and response regulator CckA
MSSSPYSPSVILLMAPPAPDLERLRTVTADALVLSGSDAVAQALMVGQVRPDLPLVVLADVGPEAAHDLQTVADEIRPAAASAPEVFQAVRQSILRRQRYIPASTPTSEPHADGAPPEPLRTIARLAAGLGHEFNNLLLVIDGSADLLRERLAPASPLIRAVDSITDACRRAATLTRQLLAFGRQQALVPAPVDLNAVITDTLPALHRTLGGHARVATRLGADLPLVRVDAAQLGEALTSLAAVALDSMPDGGTLTLETDACTMTERDRVERPWLQPGDYLRVRVRDTGRGIAQQTLPHLFEPFFLPPAGKRLGGLTLSSVYGVVKQSGGYIWAESGPEQGTQVTILLPPAPDEDRMPLLEAVRKSPSARVLLVEDLDSVRDVLASLLELRGFEVLTAASAEEALDVAREHRFDILLTDVMLSGRSGPELARELASTRPGTPVLFMSGHPANAMTPRDLVDPRTFLQKPFTSSTLVERLQELLGRAADGQPV